MDGEFRKLKESEEKELCFVIMSFSGNPALHDFYQEAVKPTVEKFGLRCERVDEQEFNGRIKERIIQNLRQAKFVIADVTEARPNCYYELGLAHALGKQVIHISHTRDDIHFDVSDFNFIIYSRIQELKEKLEKRIPATLREIERLNQIRLLWVLHDKENDVSVEKAILSSNSDLKIVDYWYFQDSVLPPPKLPPFDVVLYSYQAQAAGENIRNLISFLNGQDGPPLLIIYTLSRIEGDDSRIISTYENRKISNMPSTLRRAFDALKPTQN